MAKQYPTTFRAYYRKGNGLAAIQLPDYTIDCDENGMRACAIGIFMGLLTKYKDPVVFADQKGGNHYKVARDSYIFQPDNGLNPAWGQFID